MTPFRKSIIPERGTQNLFSCHEKTHLIFHSDDLLRVKFYVGFVYFEDPLKNSIISISNENSLTDKVFNGACLRRQVNIYVERKAKAINVSSNEEMLCK